MSFSTTERKQETKTEIEDVSRHMSSDIDINVNAEVVLVSTGHTIRKVPIPTANPNDPLNWGKWTKVAIVSTCCWFSIFSILSVSGLGAIMNVLFGIYSSTRPDVVAGLSTYPSLVMAFGCLVMLPLSMVIGRRPVFLLAVIVCMVSTIGAGASQTFTGHFTARIFMGLATGITESILPLILTDITFLDERGFYFGLYWAIQSGGCAALNISLSYIVAASNWRWFYWLFAICLAVGTLLVIFAAPETIFSRSPMSMNGIVVYTDEFGVTHSLSDEQAKERFGEVHEHVQADVPRKSYLSSLSPYSGTVPNAFEIWLGAYKKIAQACTSPGVIFATLASSISLGIGIAMTIIYSTVLVTRFHWSEASVGLFNVGVIPACFAAMFYSGYICDKLNIWLAARNNGVHKPEHHLLYLIVPALAGVVGIVAMAVPAQRPDKYSAWGLVVGWAIYQFSFVSILILTTSFAAEALPQNPGPAIIIVVGGKNIISFAAAQGLIPMVMKYSYMKTFMILMGIYIGIFLLGIPVYFLNGRWRNTIGKRAGAK